jgi:hypothetical protein
VVAALDSKAAELNFSVVEVNLRNEKVDSLSCKLILSRRRCWPDAHCCVQGLTDCGTLPRANKSAGRRGAAMGAWVGCARPHFTVGL